MPSMQFDDAASADDRYHHGDLRQALISAAIDLLTEEQDWSFSLRQVARRAGVSHNAPYNHFASKQELLAAVGAAGYDRLTARMQDAATQVDSAPDGLRAIGVAYTRFGFENPAHYRLMFGTALASAKDCLSPALAKSASAAKAVLRGVIERGLENGSFAMPPSNPQALDTAVLSAWALVHGLTMLLIDGLTGAETANVSAAATERVAEQVTQLLLDGMITKA